MIETNADMAVMPYTKDFHMCGMINPKTGEYRTIQPCRCVEGKATESVKIKVSRKNDDTKRD